MNTPTQLIAQLLVSFGTRGSFATRFAVEADPQVHVEGVGRVALPVTIQVAHQLCAVARPAHHGYKDQTRLDRRVRDTWEIPASRIRFDSPQWQGVLDRALQRVGRDLGLPGSARLDARLHNLLVYAPGQFFAVHQDSETGDGMLGTLVVTLPARFSGGEFVVSHQGETLRARASSSRLGMLAFYADCDHEVRPVKQGYRVVLTYQLTASDAQPAKLQAQGVAALADAVHGFWNTPVAPRWSGDTAGEAPDRLVYLLDHQYTRSGLSWARLKGADAARVAALRAVAEQLDAEIFMALADVHETWSAETDYPDHGRWNNHDGDDDDDGDDYYYDDDDLTDGTADEPELGELIDSDIELRHWLTLDGRQMAIQAGSVRHGELCLTRPSVDCSPFESEYEGYMGNYGNTMDRWYHRAAIVMWPRERAFVIRARQSPSWAVAQIADRLAAGDSAQALEWARRVQPFWDLSVSRSASNALFGATLPVAASLEDGEVAAVLLAPFSLQQLTAKMAPRLIDLLERHGLAWCTKRLDQWTAKAGHGAEAEQLTWLAKTLPQLTRAWGAATTADGAALASALVERRWGWLQQHIAQVAKTHAGSARIKALAATGAALLGLIRGSRDARLHELQQRIVHLLLSAGWPPQLPLAVLHAAGKLSKPGAAGLGLAPLRADCVQRLAARLARPERAAADWSIPRPTVMSGELEQTLAQFLEAPARQRLEWPLAQAGRQVIHEFIERHELPVRHETRRSGRPYTLVLEKTRAVFEREAAERRLWTQELAWLQQQANYFAEKGDGGD